MPGPRSSDTYTCTCTHFCGGYKTGLSRATYYRHSPYRDTAQPTSSFSTSFQSFLDNSAGNSGSGQSGRGLGSQLEGNTDDLEAEFPTSPGSPLVGHVLDGSTRNFEEAAGVNVVNLPLLFTYVILKQSWALES
jgi:hypothetical protein